MKCEKCNSVVKDGAIFCSSCGSPIVTDIECQNCATINPANSKFCRNCGKSILSTSVMKQEETTQNEELKLYIKCNDCDDTFFITEDMAEMQGTYKCPNCGGEVEISFFGLCEKCNEYVGFQHSTTKALLGIGKAVFQSVFGEEKSTVSLLGSIFSKTAYAKEWGECPFCKREYLMCPKCNGAVHWPQKTGYDEKKTCPECKTKMIHP